MKRRFILYRRKRGGMFYVEDTETHKQESTGTRNRAEATALLICDRRQSRTASRTGIKWRMSVRGASDRPLLTSEHRVLWLDSTRDERGQTVAEGAKRGTSRWNPFEIELIEDFLRHVDESLASSPGAKNSKLDVGVISFYLAQTNELRERVGSKGRDRWQHLDVQVNTVDQFQGRECSVIIVSLVRTGEVSGELVKDYRRINVAFSRAKNLLVIVGSRSSFEAAAVPICPVEGGEANAKKVYQ